MSDEAQQIAARIAARTATAADFDRLDELGKTEPGVHGQVHEEVGRLAHEMNVKLDTSSVRALAQSILALADVLERTRSHAAK